MTFGRRELPPRKPMTWPGVQSFAPSIRVDEGLAVPKLEYIRSEALMVAYRQIPCQQCGRSDGTVCGAHSNWAEHGKGRSIKASDIYCASLCFTCHGRLDQGKDMSADERREFWLRAHRKTAMALIELGMWPFGVPLPRVHT